MDLISTNYPQVLSSAGLALVLDPALLQGQEESDGGDSGIVGAKRALGEVNAADESSAVSKRAKVETEVVASDAISVVSDCNNSAIKCSDADAAPLPQEKQQHSYELNMFDTALRKDTRPLVVGCSCHACRHHSRTYIHHLHICKEILAEVLLYHHNMHQTMALFAAARAHIKNKSFDKWVKDIESSDVSA